MKTAFLLLMLGMSAWGQGKPKPAAPSVDHGTVGWDICPKCWQIYTLDLENAGTPKPEPMDVEAVRKRIVKRPVKSEGLITSRCLTGQWLVAHDGGLWCETDEFTCTDKRRIKLQSEDGKWHCILFPKERP